MATDKKQLLLPFGISTLSGVVVGIVTLFAINASFLRVPDAPPPSEMRVGQISGTKPSPVEERDYKFLMDRNLFRAKLQVEIPKPKTEK